MVNTAYRYFRICGLASASLLVTAASAENFRLQLPVACEIGVTCFIQNYVDADPSPAGRDHKCGTLTYDGHNGTDFRLPSLRALQVGVDVLAAASGRVLRVRDRVPDVSLRESDRDAARGVECGNGVVIEHPGGWETQYCHMARNSLKIQPGQDVKAGQPLGRIGLSGLTEYPHLHFTVRYRGEIVDPFAHGATPGACDGGENLWEPSLHEKLAYRERAILNAGFAAASVTMQTIDAGEADNAQLDADSPVLAVFVRAIGLKAGDAQTLSLRAPDGMVIASNKLKPLDRNKAQTMMFAGRRRPANGWERGTYQATYIVEQGARIVLQRNIQLVIR